MKIKLFHLAQLLGGKLIINGDEYSPFTPIELSLNVDSRKIKDGEVFVCIRGINSNGHDFAEDALKNGAIGLISERELKLDKDSYFQIVVSDTKEALKKVGKFILDEVNPVQICITGSAGKTTVKELIYSVLSPKLDISKTFGNFNTPIGLPLSLTKINMNTKYFVAEISASYPGEMDENLSIVTPDIGIITNIGESHLEFLGDINGVFAEKVKLAKALKENCFLLVNGDNLLSRSALNFVSSGYSYGIKSLSNIIGENIVFNGSFTYFDVTINGKKAGSFSLETLGEHFVLNSLPAIYLGFTFGLTSNEIKTGLLKFKPLPGRGRLLNLRDGIKVFDDSYNANPLSFEASIRAFDKIHKINSILVMGDMLELGAKSDSLHRQIAKIVSANSFSKVLYVGKYASQIKDELSPDIEFIQFNDSFAISNYLKETVKSGDAILIKGSNSMNLEKVVEVLINW